jgi:uncharacterized protein YdhG (YjbR/CyaY superfamily)
VVGTIDDFLAGLPRDQRAVFEQVRKTAIAEVPEADQGTSYGMPALRYRGKALLGFAQAKAHLSIFPFSPAVVDQVRQRLDGYSLSKGTIRFSQDHPLPDDVVCDTVRYRRDEIEAQLQ